MIPRTGRRFFPFPLCLCSLFCLPVLLAGAVPAATVAASPHLQRRAEFEAVIASASAIFGPVRPIDAVIRVGPDRYEVKAGACQLIVRILDRPGTDGGGPRDFLARPQAPRCPPIRARP